MTNVLKDLTPKKFFESFEAISAIPRKSLDEERIADFLVNYANERGLFCIRDDANNVFVRVPATKGRENDPAILLQGHTDMVCEKNEGVEHDFDKDGLDLYIDGDFIKARGTTLGADDGVAVAMMMAVMDGEFESHPTVECLFTSAEEIGLIGAGAFDYSNVTARRLLNLDSAEEGCVTVGCAGGVRSSGIFKGERTSFEGECVSITVKGLLGGHSGEDINRGRHSANIVLMRFLRALCLKEDIRIVYIAGGGKDALLGVEERTDEIVDASADGGIVEAEQQGIQDERTCDDQNRQADAAAAEFCQGNDADEADDNLISLKLRALLDDGQRIEREVEEGTGTCGHQQDIVPRNVVDALLSLFRGEDEISHQDDQADKRGQADFLQPGGEQRDINAEYRK